MKNKNDLPGAYVTSVHYPESRVIGDLPTKDEYIQKHTSAKNEAETYKWSEPKYKCPSCGGGMRKNLTTVLRSHPAKYAYRCNSCGNEEYLEV